VLDENSLDESAVNRGARSSTLFIIQIPLLTSRHGCRYKMIKSEISLGNNIFENILERISAKNFENLLIRYWMVFDKIAISK
jgi:hypothetical protein